MKRCMSPPTNTLTSVFITKANIYLIRIDKDRRVIPRISKRRTDSILTAWYQPTAWASSVKCSFFAQFQGWEILFFKSRKITFSEKLPFSFSLSKKNLTKSFFFSFKNVFSLIFFPALAHTEKYFGLIKLKSRELKMILLELR